jgi:hypothetical protein
MLSICAGLGPMWRRSKVRGADAGRTAAGSGEGFEAEDTRIDFLFRETKRSSALR